MTLKSKHDSIGMTCIRAIYDEIGMPSCPFFSSRKQNLICFSFAAPNTVSVVNTAVLDDGNVTAIYGSAYQPYPETQPGYLIVSFPGREFRIISFN